MKRAFRRVTQWLVRLLLRVGLLPASTKADTDTMGEYKRLMAEKDDPKPGLVLPDPNAPHAALIRRVRLYAQNGAKALAPLLDGQVPPSRDDIAAALAHCEALRQAEQDKSGVAETEAAALLDELELLGTNALRAVHTAYNAPWTVIDGEVYEYESEKRRRVVQ